MSAKGEPMQYKMTEEFASAMVTVIPIILLVASVEFNSITRAQHAEMREYLEDQRARLRALREGRATSAPVPAVPAAATRNRRIATWFWAVLVMSHIWAEVALIEWLGGTDRHPEPVRAALIAWITMGGFFAVLAAWMLTTSQFLFPYSREFKQVTQELDALQNQSAPSD
jgi:hypothetical protein